MSRFIVISGIPASGKTTLINNLIDIDSKIALVPEHVDWVKSEFPPKPTNKQEKIDKQQFFLALDIERYKWAKEALKTHDIVVSDTDFLSPLSHNYAERILMPEFDIYEWMIEQYSKALKSGDLGLPDAYVYLDTSSNRRHKYRATDIERKRNEMFFTSPFPENMRESYHILMHDSSNHKCLNNLWYDQEKDEQQVADDIYKYILGVKHPDHKIDELIEKLQKTL